MENPFLELEDEVKRLRAAVAERDRLLGQWMFWASGVAFKSELGEELVAATDAVLGPAKRSAP